MLKEIEKRIVCAWEKYSDADKKEVFDFSNRYKDFISKAKTERECVIELIEIAKSNGYKDLDEIIKKGEKIKVGDRLYSTNKGKSLAMFIIGDEPLENGLRIVGSHIDAPRIDLKANPLYEDSNLAMMETHYYGGIKKYQWVALPLAIHGVIIKKDGSLINISIGEDDEDPVVGISDLLIHLSSDQLGKKASVVIEGEDLNLLRL